MSHPLISKFTYSTNMLKSLLSTAILATITLGFAASAHAEMKVGTLDMNNVFTQYHRTKDAETKLNEARAAAKRTR